MMELLDAAALQAEVDAAFDIEIVDHAPRYDVGNDLAANLAAFDLAHQASLASDPL